ncbi:hypothetical protein [Botrimarina sp.]|uniref:toxin-antitoxin system YwqK family antitoxin n=1 Tax=Botrimarina sp. TaxID=2795802 RepID=UPI0032EFCA87
MLVRSIAALLAVLAAAGPGAADQTGGVRPHEPAAPEHEVIQQRDQQGRVRVYREVRLNQAGDYVNHGAYREWDAAGQLIGQGRYAWGEATGVWRRWATAADAPLLASAPFRAFEGPFLSQAEYRNGRPHGVWRIIAADGRTAAEVPLRDGLRHGSAVLYQPDGAAFSRQAFSHGVMEGPLETTDQRGEPQTVAVYEAGRRQLTRVEQYPSGAEKSREEWLGPPARVAEADDPWRLCLARFEESGAELRHGRREAWWPNGQKKLSVEYRFGHAVGEARWWHENGQLAVHGVYEQGRAEGLWSWWRESGARRAACRYAAGQPDGAAALWAADGRRVQANAERVAQLAPPDAAR